MLSWKSGRKIATVKGGKRDKQFLYIQTDADDLEPDNSTENPLEFLNGSFFNKYKLKIKEMTELRKAIRRNTEPTNEDLVPIFNEARKMILNNLKKEVILSDGKLEVMPNKKVVEKIYISAPSGAGKSTWIGNWMTKYKKMFKDSEIYVFSRVNEDAPLDKHDPIRVELNEDLLNDPIECEELENSLVVFDDTDTISDKRLRDNINILRDSILECGRHYDTRILVCSHQITNYKQTRIILNEATGFVIFPKASSSYHINRFLKAYIGLSKEQIKKIYELKSRWVYISKSFPQYIIYERGAFLLY